MFSQKTSKLIFLQRTFFNIYPELQNSVRERTFSWVHCCSEQSWSSVGGSVHFLVCLFNDWSWSVSGKFLDGVLLFDSFMQNPQNMLRHLISLSC